MDEFEQSPLTLASIKFLPPEERSFAFRHNSLRTKFYKDLLHTTPLPGVVAVRHG
jgi:hypothetical protein